MFRRSRRRLHGPLLLAIFGFAVAATAVDSLSLLSPGVSARAQRDPALAGRPTHITDGDTIRFGPARVRLYGIQAPEMDTPDGPRARAALVAIIGTGEVVCQDTGDRSYRRVVARCFDAQGRDLSEQMVREGWATDWPRFSRGRYALAQGIAFIEGRGLHRR